MLNRFAALAAILAAGTIGLTGQVKDARDLAVQLKVLFPSATSFGPKEGKPPVIKAYVTDPKTKAQALLGYAAYTTDWQPFERGYDGPIKILVGVGSAGVVTNVVVVEHKEPYGYRSIDQQRFADQFINKNIQDPFKVRGDVNAVSGATASIGSATRSIRDTAKRVAEAYLSGAAK
jgi:transcriptional regulator of nitric oxide reductase